MKEPQKKQKTKIWKIEEKNPGDMAKLIVDKLYESRPFDAFFDKLDLSYREQNALQKKYSRNDS